MARSIQARRREENGSFHHELIVRTDPEQVQPVVQHADEEGARQRAPDRAPPAEQAGTADDDGGFWLVREYLNMSVPQTLKTWTIIETIVAVAGLGAVLLLSLVVG